MDMISTNQSDMEMLMDMISWIDSSFDEKIIQSWLLIQETCP